MVQSPGVVLQFNDQVARSSAYAGPIQIYDAATEEAGITQYREWSELGRLVGSEIRKLGIVCHADDNIPYLLTSDFVIRTRGGIRWDDVPEVRGVGDIRHLATNPFTPTEHLVRTSLPPHDVIPVIQTFRRLAEVTDAYPNLVILSEADGFPVDDPVLKDQWHHHNAADAGVGTLEAWDKFGRGVPSTIVATIDSAPDPSHSDLVNRLWSNPSNVNEHGYRFSGCDCASDDPCEETIDGAPCGDIDYGVATDHALAVSLLAVSEYDNGIGGAGACPDCSIMLIQRGVTTFATRLAYQYVKKHNVAVACNSYTIPGGKLAQVVFMFDAVFDAATNGRDGHGAVVLFSMGNFGLEACAPLGDPVQPPPIYPNAAGHDFIMGIGASTQTNQRADYSNWGACLDVLAPGTDIVYSESGLGDPLKKSGTSMAVPIVGGIAGLVIGLAPDLSSVEVQRLLQDTADRIEPSAAKYDLETGYSQTQTHGHGRVNAYESSQVVATAAVGGRGGVDLFIRDNELDWGNTEQPSNRRFDPLEPFIPHWESPDIKIDSPTDGWQPIPKDSAEFAALEDEDPVADQENRVYVRVRNRGPKAATQVTVNLYWAFAGALLPQLPGAFWPQFPTGTPNTSPWKHVGTGSLPSVPYCGASIAGQPDDPAAIVQFTLLAPPIDVTQPNPSHYCMLAMVDSPDDPIHAGSKASIIPDFITPRDNNVAQRNLALSSSLSISVVLNPFSSTITSKFRIDPSGLAQRVVGLPLHEELEFAPFERRKVQIHLARPRDSRPIRFIQETRIRGVRVWGGITLR